MEDFRVKRVNAPSYRVFSSAASEGRPGSSFQGGFEEQLRQSYKKRVAELFDEIRAEAEDIFTHVDLSKFEKYRSLISRLLSELVNNAYLIKTDLATDEGGNRRVLTLVSVIDVKLEEMAADLLRQNGRLIDYLGRVDELRGLIMDLLC